MASPEQQQQQQPRPEPEEAAKPEAEQAQPQSQPQPQAPPPAEDSPASQEKRAAGEEEAPAAAASGAGDLAGSVSGSGASSSSEDDGPEEEEEQAQAQEEAEEAAPTASATTATATATAVAAPSSSKEKQQRGLPVESRRRLGGMEMFFASSVPRGLGLIYYVVDFEGPPDTDLLKESMRLQLKRHPNLRSRIVGDVLEAIPFEACPDFTVDYVESEDVIGYTERILKEAQEMKDGRALYPWKVALHHTPSSESTHLLLLIHHVISDGDSILRLLQSLVVGMHALAGQSEAQRAQALAQVECLPQMPSMDAMLYPKYNGWYLVYHARTLLKELWKVILQPRIPTPVRTTWSDRERTTRISSFTLDAPDFKRLLAACKRNGTSVTGALVAATCEALQGFIPTRGEYLIKADVLVNFRAKCADTGPAASQDSHMLYAVPFDMLVAAGGAPDTALDFWAAARESKAEIDRSAAEPHRVVDALDFFYVLGHHPVAWPLIKVFAASFKQGRQKAISVSNLGRTDGLYQACGPWKLGRMQMGIDELLIGHSIFLAVASHEGRLNFTLSYADPIVTRAMAEEYGQAVVRSLIENCPPTPEEAAVPPSPVTPVSITAKPHGDGDGSGAPPRPRKQVGGA